eukprot:GAHX01002771.1.p1 GENE.GAHX01002771.1~~GAHX01002771.1.p1  ORF type:complete len:450 (-),score=37.76 GAHX01002771.1:107-1456(-)
MKSDWLIYGQFLIMYSTFKLTNKSWSFFILVGVDNNKKTITFGWFLLANETFNLLEKAFSWFFEYNDRSVNKKYITDKDFSERKVLGIFLQTSQRRLCRFHVMKFWKVYISQGRFNLNREHKKWNLGVLKKVIYCHTEAKYNELIQSLSPQVKEYYDRNWHGIRHEFIASFKGKSMTMNIHTRNNAESYFSSLKKLFKLKNNIGEFLLEISDFIKYKRNILKRAAMLEATKIRKFYESTMIDFMQTKLSEFAFKMLYNSLKKANRIVDCNQMPMKQLNECCWFRYTYLIPCEHVIYYWKSNQTIKLENFIHPRWFLRETNLKTYSTDEQPNISSGSLFKVVTQRRTPTNFKKNIKQNKYPKLASKHIDTRIYNKTSSTEILKESARFLKLRRLSDKLANRLSEHSDHRFSLYILDKVIEDIEEKGIFRFSELFGISYSNTTEKDGINSK